MSKVTKFKVVFTGDQNVGKTSVISRFMFDTYNDTPNPTVGIDFLTKTLQVENETIRLQLWDTAGQERYRSLIPSYIKDSDACIVIYDVSAKSSYENLSKWIDFIKETRGDQAAIFVVANKVDAPEREVETTQGENFAKNNGAFFYEVSAKTGQNIQQLFRNIAVKLQEKNNAMREQLEQQVNANNNKAAKSGPKESGKAEGKSITIGSQDSSQKAAQGRCKC